MDSGGDVMTVRSVSCPLCGARSNISVGVPTTKPRTWTHRCPVCCKPWKVKVWATRGRPELLVEPDLDLGKRKPGKRKE
jgi:Cysteine-rich CPXCG